jgi:hypothetical protein
MAQRVPIEVTPVSSPTPWATGARGLPELAQTSVLHTIAEISAAFVGFSLVAGLLGAGPADQYRSFSIRDVAEIGLSCLAGALLPSALHALALSPETTWRLASAAFSLAWLGGAFIGIRRFWRSEARDQAPRLLWFGPVAGLVGNLLLWWNVFSPDLAPGRYVLALLLYLAVAGLSFIAAVFHGRNVPAA